MMWCGVYSNPWIIKDFFRMCTALHLGTYVNTYICLKGQWPFPGIFFLRGKQRSPILSDAKPTLRKECNQIRLPVYICWKAARVTFCVKKLGRYVTVLGTFRSEDEDDYEYEFSVLSTRTSKNVGLETLCACSVRTTRARSRPRLPI